MPTSAEPRIDDIRRIAFVTRRFHELQGLGTAMFGCGLVFGVVASHAVGLAYRPSPMQALSFANVLGVFASLPVSRLYRQTFGDPVAGPRAKMLAGLLILTVMTGGIGDMWAQFNARQGPSMMAVVLASYGTWIVVRDWRWRVHYVAAAAAGLMGAFVTAAVPAKLEGCCFVNPPRVEAYLLSYTLVGLGLVFVGLMDHHLLASSLVPSRPAGVRPPRAVARASHGLTRATVGALFCVASGPVIASVNPALIGPVLTLTLQLALFGTLMVVVVVPQWRNVRQAHQLLTMRSDGIAHDVRLSASHGSRVVVEQPAWQIGTDSLALVGAVALAAAADAWVVPHGTPSLLALTIAFVSGWVAVRDWRYRPYYLIGAVAASAAAFVTAGMSPSRSFAFLIVAVSGPLVVEGLLDYWVFMRHNPVPGSAPEKVIDVDTI